MHESIQVKHAPEPPRVACHHHPQASFRTSAPVPNDNGRHTRLTPTLSTLTLTFLPHKPTKREQKQGKQGRKNQQESDDATDPLLGRRVLVQVIELVSGFAYEPLRHKTRLACLQILCLCAPAACCMCACCLCQVLVVWQAASHAAQVLRPGLRVLHVLRQRQKVEACHLICVIVLVCPG